MEEDTLSCIKKTCMTNLLKWTGRFISANNILTNHFSGQLLHVSVIDVSRCMSTSYVYIDQYRVD